VHKLRIGSRASALAVRQAELVKEKIMQRAHYSADNIEIVKIKTTGDMIQHRDLAEIGGKGLFTKEIEEALLAKEIDLAVHSMKDVQAVIPDGLKIDCFLEREDPSDAFISYKHQSIEQLPIGAVVGTSSTRRKSILLHHRPDLIIIPFRGNVLTRLDKLANKEVDATILAVAGLKRLSIDRNCYSIIDSSIMLPAVAQGVIAIESRINDNKISTLLELINHHETSVLVAAERAFLIELGASCTTPIAALAVLKNEQLLQLRALIAEPSSYKLFLAEKTGAIEEASKIGQEVAIEILRRMK
jgi:hydroxymethylbilane synthase